MAVEVRRTGKYGECVSCLAKGTDDAPIVGLRAGREHTHGVSWTVLHLCPKCGLDLLTKLAGAITLPDGGLENTVADLSGEYAGIIEKASLMGEMLHDVIERLRHALGGVVEAFHEGQAVDVPALESVLDSTRRLLTGDITNRPG